MWILLKLPPRALTLMRIYYPCNDGIKKMLFQNYLRLEEFCYDWHIGFTEYVMSKLFEDGDMKSIFATVPFSLIYTYQLEMCTKYRCVLTWKKFADWFLPYTIIIHLCEQAARDGLTLNEIDQFNINP